MGLDERKQRVLRAVVEDYVSSAEPVGSRTLARKYGLGVSPATIRNEMADLEDLGYLEQPHTSSGRVPSDKGYRLYVDRLMEKPQLSPEEVQAIRRAFERRAGEMEWLVQQTVRLLSQATRYASVAVGPMVRQATVRSLTGIPVDDRRVLLVLVTDQEYVQHRLLELPEGVSAASILAALGVLSERMRGLSLDRITRSVLQDILEAVAGRRALLDEVVRILEDGLRTVEARVYVGGTTNILSQPEFQEVDRVRALFSLLEDQHLVQELLVLSDQGGKWRVVIGKENPFEEAQDCSVVMAVLTRHGRVISRVGVLGPRRMEYPRVVAILEEVVRSFEEAYAG